MIKNYHLVKLLEKDFISNNKLSYKQSLKLFESMRIEAKRLRILPSKNPFEGTEIAIRIARILNSCLNKSSPNLSIV